LQALRELHDAIDTFENLRQRLGKNTDSTLAQLLTDFEAALNDDKEGLARSMATAAGKLAQLAADESLRDRYLHLRARFEVKYGNSDEALRIQRVTFLRTLSSGPFVNNDMINRMGNFVTILWANGRSAEARRMTRAARELLHDNPKSEQWRYILDAAEGTTAMELGDLPTAITAYTSTYNKLPEPQRHVVEAYRRMALFVSGTMSFEALDLLELTHRIQAVAMLRMAAIEETSKSLKRALAKYTGAGPTLAGQDLLTTQHIRCLADAIKGDSGALKRFQEFAQKERFKDRLPTVLHDFVIAVYVCQVARLAGNRDVALDHLMQAEKEFCGLDSEITPPIWLRIIHTRNALELIPLKAKSAAQRNLRARVKEFVDDYISRGYVLLKDFPA
ncbi:MAG: hypothetical protein L6Q71_12455, partial [Planctomycetes bacterium]|nr:hypothetical protein [Planctomycetota bacterium]